MIFAHPHPAIDTLRRALRTLHYADEAAVLTPLLQAARLGPEAQRRVQSEALRLVDAVRRHKPGGLDAFLQEYQLSTQEGVVLMCLAEALLRIPDAETRDRLIRDKLGGADWGRHLGRSDSLFVNASTWALMLTGRVLGETWAEGEAARVLARVVSRGGEPVIRQSVIQAMRILGRQFVMGRSIGEALERAVDGERRGYRHSFDMLGEAAHTAADAERYHAAYAEAIAAIGQASGGRGPNAGPGISVKLSALHPRYEFAQAERVMGELVPRLRALALLARNADIALCVDAEEADRLELSLDVVQAVFEDPAMHGWDGFGLAVQAYQKRATAVIDILADMARRAGRRLQVRLVKGAYWDSEIKRAQERGLPSYPVFTRKASTDVSWLACARKLLAAPELFYPQFATHNAHSLAYARGAAGGKPHEFQRLHGMGEPLYDPLVGGDSGLACRIYAPVGSHEDLLPYLVRRLLENGANTSFVNRLADADSSPEALVADPVERVAALAVKPHPAIRLPADLYQPERRNSGGIDLSAPEMLEPLALTMAAFDQWWAGPLVGDTFGRGEARSVVEPADHRRPVGTVVDATPADIDRALDLAVRAQSDWDALPAVERAAVLDHAADLYEADRAELMALCVREAGKTIADSVAEVREAVDFLRYYAARLRRDFAPLALPGPTGESNALSLRGRGVFCCISPWNFPLAIFTGQVAAALAAGNAVVAKPAEQTPLIAYRAVQLLRRAGVPESVLHLLPGDGATVGAGLVADRRVAGVAFTGGTDTARAINRALAERPGPIVPLIAETGGLNALIADSSALTEQLVADVVVSAFQSAGQRCSALRVLFLQQDGADTVLRMLAGAMDELRIGDPRLLSTDLGPVIDEPARQALVEHAARLERTGRAVRVLGLPPGTELGTFFAPAAYEVGWPDLPEREVFGPILHVVRYAQDRLEQVLDAIAGTGYGLTLGVHSRIDATIRQVLGRARVGNAYVNRSMIGAVVGTQPFGGEGLSGTGPKAGGPRYLARFATERSVSINTTAAGGNASLLSMGE
jgi:RHH-type proline utilization regulon transcriptional repressor/proline dehydrogenase/delta 1-pyrroline-5-carboxylate dehydrogenase